MATSNTLNRLLFAISIIVYVTALLLYSFWNYSYQKEKILAQIDIKLYNNAISLKYILPDDFHDRAIDAQSISINEEKYIASKLTNFVKEAGFKYTYTIIKKENKLFFIASDIIAAPEKERGTFFYQEYENADESFINAFEKETSTYKTVTDQWGTVRTVMVPEKSPEGTKYLACADYDISYVKGLLQKNLFQSIATVLFFLLLAMPIIKVYTKSHKELLKNIKESESFHKALFENNTSSILLIDSESTDILDANPSACSFYGYSKENITQMNISDINTLSNEELQNEILKAKTEQRSYFNFRHRLADNSIKEVEVYTGPVKIDEKLVLCSIIHDISERKTSEKEREKLIQELSIALSDIKTLKGMVPICSNCKKIRDDKGYWNLLESYIEKHSEASFSHGMCPECSRPRERINDWYIDMKKKRNKKD